MRRLCPMLVWGLLVALPVAASAEEQQPKQQQQQKQKQKQKKGDDPEEVVKQGQVQVVRSLEGGEPRLTDEQGQRWLLTGGLREELLRLSGHPVKVWASRGEKKLLTPTLAVRRYELLASDGRQPPLGLLRRAAPQTFLLERDAGNLQIEGRPALLRQLDRWVGCKVWLAGEVEGKVIKAFKFGWISCKKSKPIKPEKERKQ